MTERTKPGFSHRLIAGVILSIPLLLVGGCGYAVTSYPYSDGYRDGEIQKVSTKGWIRKSVEGELATAGSRSARTAIGNVFDFSVKNKDVIATLKDLPPGTLVRLHYKQYFWVWNTETNYLIHKIEVLEPAVPLTTAPK